MIEELRKAREKMNNSQRKVFDLVYNAMPGKVTNFTLATEGCLSYTGRISEANRILREHGWAIVCKPGNPEHHRANTYLYSLREIGLKTDKMGQFVLPGCAETSTERGHNGSESDSVA